MSKKHYEAIAKILCDTQKQVAGTQANQRFCQEVVDSTVGELINVFENDNPRFNKERFLEAIDRCVRRG